MKFNKLIAMASLSSLLFVGCLTEQEVLVDNSIDHESTKADLEARPQYTSGLTQEQINEALNQNAETINRLPSDISVLADPLNLLGQDLNLGKVAVTPQPSVCSQMKAFVIATAAAAMGVDPATVTEDVTVEIIDRNGAMINFCADLEDPSSADLKSYVDSSTIMVYGSLASGVNIVEFFFSSHLNLTRNNLNEVDGFTSLMSFFMGISGSVSYSIGFQDLLFDSRNVNPPEPGPVPGSVLITMNDGTFICSSIFPEDPFANFYFQAECYHNGNIVGAIALDEIGFIILDPEGNVFGSQWGNVTLP